MAIKIENLSITLAVRDLVQFNKKSFPLLSSFPLPQRGILGKQAQFKLQQQKEKSFGLFHQEYPVRGTVTIDPYTFTIQGRIDGVFFLQDRIEIEEIKSVILTPGDFKNLNIEKYPEFSEQALFYCYLLQKEQKGVEVKPYLTVMNLVDNKVRNFNIPFSPLVVENLLRRRLQLILEEIRTEDQITRQRVQQLSATDFSLPENRPQQQHMMNSVRDCLQDQRHLLVSAPTGTGKTAAALYPALQFAIKNNKKIFFATAKTTQQQMVKETLIPLLAGPLDLKVLFLRNTESMCANSIYFCHEDFCPYAKQYQDRMLNSAILGILLNNKLIEPGAIFQEAKNHMLCPAEVMMDLTPYADIITGDYNYVFDPLTFLRRIFQYRDYNQWILILDEAHNLYQRGLDYYSPRLRRRDVATLLRFLRDKKYKVYTALARNLKILVSMFQNIHLEGESGHSGQQYFELNPDKKEWQQVFCQFEADFIKYLIHKVRKKILLQDDPLEQFYFKFRRFIQVLKLESRALIVFYSAEEEGILQIQCCDPAEQLSQRINGFHTVIAMSATVDPLPYYRTVLGLDPDRTTLLSLDSPFPAENRKIIIVPGLSTLYKKRYQSYPLYAEIIEKVIDLKKGNYIAFMPSFEFLYNVNVFLGRVPCEKIIQMSGMNLHTRDDLLNRFKDTAHPKLLLAVMGGIFAEGVDFAGEMCIGVIVFGPGLPQISYERELIRRYYDQKQDNGFEYAYLYPGMNKVIQSVGRLIRSRQDKGIIVLVEERFTDDRVNILLPDYWFQHTGDVIITNDYEPAILDFWTNLDKKK